MLYSVRNTFMGVKPEDEIRQITDYKHLVGYKNVYRTRIGDYCAFFTFLHRNVDDIVFFQYLVCRGEAYGKKMEESLRRADE